MWHANLAQRNGVQRVHKATCVHQTGTHTLKQGLGCTFHEGERGSPSTQTNSYQPPGTHLRKAGNGLVHAATHGANVQLALPGRLCQLRTRKLCERDRGRGGMTTRTPSQSTTPNNTVATLQAAARTWMSLATEMARVDATTRADEEETPAAAGTYRTEHQHTTGREQGERQRGWLPSVLPWT
jgi:hypothetical protein